MRQSNLLNYYQKSYQEIVDSALGEKEPFSLKKFLQRYIYPAWHKEFLAASTAEKIAMTIRLFRQQLTRVALSAAALGIIFGVLLSGGKKVPELPQGITVEMVEQVHRSQEITATVGEPVGSFALITRENSYLPTSSLPSEVPIGTRLQIYFAFDRSKAAAVIDEIAAVFGWRLQVQETISDRFGYRVIVDGYDTGQMAESMREKLLLDHVVRIEDKYYPASAIFFDKERAADLARSIRYNRVKIISDYDTSVVYAVITPTLESAELETVANRLKLLGYNPLRI